MVLRAKFDKLGPKCSKLEAKKFTLSWLIVDRKLQLSYRNQDPNDRLLGSSNGNCKPSDRRLDRSFRGRDPSVETKSQMVEAEIQILSLDPSSRF